MQSVCSHLRIDDPRALRRKEATLKTQKKRRSNGSKPPSCALKWCLTKGRQRGPLSHHWTTSRSGKVCGKRVLKHLGRSYNEAPKKELSSKSNELRSNLLRKGLWFWDIAVLKHLETWNPSSRIETNHSPTEAHGPTAPKKPTGLWKDMFGYVCKHVAI